MSGNVIGVIVFALLLAVLEIGLYAGARVAARRGPAEGHPTRARDALDAHASEPALADANAA